MTIEREKAHERGQMMQRRKQKQSQNIMKSGLGELIVVLKFLTDVNLSLS